MLPALNAGGVERGTLEISEALVKAGHPAFVASSGGKLTPTLERLGGTPLLVSSLKKHLLLPYSIQRLKALIKQHNITLVHARSRAPAWAAYYAAKACGIPYITTFHGAYSIQNRLKKTYNTIMARGEKVIAPSRFIYDHLIENYALPPEKIELIHRGVDLTVFNPDLISPEAIQTQRQGWNVSPEERVFLFPGRLTAIKGHENVLKTLKNHPKTAFKVVILGSWSGKKGYFERLNHLIQDLGLAANVLISPHTSSIATCYAAADAVLCPSTKPESFGRTIAEAGAMGKPVLTTNIGGGKEIVVPETTGFLVPPHDLTALDQALTTLLSLDKSDLIKMGRAAKAHIQTHFPLTKMQEKTLDLYQRVSGQ